MRKKKTFQMYSVIGSYCLGKQQGVLFMRVMLPTSCYNRTHGQMWSDALQTNSNTPQNVYFKGVKTEHISNLQNSSS